MRVAKRLSLRQRETIVNLFYVNKLQFERSKYKKLQKLAEYNNIVCSVKSIRKTMIKWQINLNFMLNIKIKIN